MTKWSGSTVKITEVTIASLPAKAPDPPAGGQLMMTSAWKHNKAHLGKVLEPDAKGDFKFVDGVYLNANQRFKIEADGTLKHVGTGKCVIYQSKWPSRMTLGACDDPNVCKPKDENPAKKGVIIYFPGVDRCIEDSSSNSPNGPPSFSSGSTCKESYTGHAWTIT
eukprot:gnl/TRDRNA2_/TRDRNA2_175980_c8_seq13.p1 gnl/TRDRNA2_/TRDRNA2_175980_c8~~gnl/TRDRNA2_/TRDRNA2_175980_c8_seq13.p1  ORF type:complete len:165 (-),score=24.55 gnl/TRDRNA2_/TRDRNA2_175980_c8_seq13:50-544(-)